MNKVKKAEKSIHLPHSFIMNNKEVSIVKSAEAFNNYFFNMAEDLHSETDNDISLISLLNVYQNDFSQMNIIPVTEGEIRSICSLKAKDSSRYDRITTKILNMYNSLISILFLTFVINLLRLVFFLTILNM